MKNNDKKLPKQIRILKIYDTVACIAIIALFLSNMIMSWNLPDGKELPYFNRHFLTPIGLTLMGSVAFTLPYINQSSNGDPHGDKVMKIVGILFVLVAIITLIISFS